MRLLILLFCFHGIIVSSGHNCTYQVATLAVKYGGSVTIPCSFSSSEELEENTKLKFQWWETAKGDCSFSKKTITSRNISEKYKDRLTRRMDPNKKRTVNLMITELRINDGPRFCCGVSNNKSNFIQNNTFGTLLKFPDEKSVTQLDELIGVPDEDVIIPCHHPKEDTAKKVSWYIADTPHTCNCTRKLHTWTQADVRNRFSLVNFPHDVSLRIHKIIQGEYFGFCCEVTTGRAKTLLSNQTTKLIITGLTPSVFSVNQPVETTAQKGDSVTLNCPYSIDSPYIEREVVRLSVYWRVGNVAGPYAYHPHQEMVHPNYKERATITGTSDLFIEDVQMADSTSFYCFVVIKLCTTNGYRDDIQHGNGTKLIIKAEPKGDHRNIIIITSVIGLIILILIVSLYFVSRGIRKKKSKSSDQQMDAIHATDKGDATNEEHPYCMITRQEAEEDTAYGRAEGERLEMDSGRMADRDHGKHLYATLDETTLRGGPKAWSPEKKQDVVYADVVLPAY